MPAGPGGAGRDGEGRTILFAQELGAGYGHLTHLLSVARHFRRARRIFAMPHPELARPMIETQLGPAATCLPAPRLPFAQGPPGTPERSIADILESLGFANVAALSSAAARWAAILDERRPDLVVADYAPTLRVAAAGRVPHVVVSRGVASPPDISPVPSFRPAAPGRRSGVSRSEARVLRAANAVRERLALTAFPRLASLLQGDETFVTSFPEMDLHAEDRERPTIGPLNVPRTSLGPPLGERTAPHVFCYLDAEAPPTNVVLTALNGLPRPSRVFIRNIDPHALAPHCAPQVEISVEPADLAALLPQTRLVVHAAAQGIAGVALLAGTPQLLVPHHLDGHLIAERLLALGVAETWPAGRDADPASIRAGIERMLHDGALEARARTVAAGMQARRRPVPERPVVDACRALLLGASQM